MEEQFNFNKWLETHRLFNTTVTLRIAKEIGYFNKFDFLRAVSNYSKSGGKDYLYLIDEKWLVTINTRTYGFSEFFYKYSVEEIVEIESKQKEFGRRVARLAQKVDIPWAIGVFAGHHESDEEVIKVLTALKAAKGTADDAQSLKLTSASNSEQRTAIFEQLLGETWHQLNCRGQKATSTLANYLIN